MLALGQSKSVDVLILNGTVFTGHAGETGERFDIGISGPRIVFVGDADKAQLSSDEIIDATGLIVTPGFIDPHTHALEDLLSVERKQNLNYLTQGVTTVFTGNDGGGPISTGQLLAGFKENGVGTNVALFVGHSEIRKKVLGSENRPPNSEELRQMRSIVRGAMEEGALGLSAGLFYAPASYASTKELIALAEEAASFGGIYESHLRDESSYSIGLLAAVDEAIEIGRASGANVHIAHIKALGIDVWGESAAVIERIETARRNGQRVTADQYPWRASGTRISNAVIPNWAKDGGVEKLHERLRNPENETRLRAEILENLRKRGGASALLIVEGREAENGKTLEEVAQLRKLDAVNAAIAIVLEGDARIASFNMLEADIEALMRQPWVVTSSDGTNGHPRKYASFPRKFSHYVEGKKTISLGEFVRQSTGLTADIFSVCKRGYLKEGYYADILVFDPMNYRDVADFSKPRLLSQGVEYLFVNGSAVIEDGADLGTLSGMPIRKSDCSTD